MTSKKEKAVSHKGLVNRESQKYIQMGWLVFKEVSYKGCQFDLVALQPQTKQLEIVEVVISSAPSAKKLAIAKELGKVRIIKPSKIKPHKNELSHILDALRNPIRLKILQVLIEDDVHRYASLCTLVGLDSNDDAGKFAYHINTLRKAELLYKSDDIYVISEKGEKLMNVFKELDYFE